MNKNYLKALLFIVIFTCMAIAADILLTYQLRSLDSGEFGIWNRVVTGRANADVLFMGSSRTQVHFDSGRIGAIIGKKSFNLGMDGTPHDLQYSMLQTYLKHNKPPEIIVQGIDITSLSRRDGVFKPERYTPYLNEIYLYNKLYSLDKTFWLNKYVPLYCFGKYGMQLTAPAIKKLLGIKDRAGIYADGYAPQDKNWDQNFEKFKNNNPGGVEYKIDKMEVCDIENIATAARNTGVDMILVYSPEYTGNHVLTKNRNQIFDEYLRISNLYHVPLWDYSDELISGNTCYFYNSQHLNRKGASLFSDSFALRFKAYLSSKNQ